MSQTSPTLALPYLQASQAQKHVTHNEALRLLDAATQLAVLAADLTDPPASPAEGDVYIPAPGPTGDWSGHGGEIAIYVSGGWAFFDPAPGWRADVIPTGDTLRFDGTVWEPVTPVLQNLPSLGINTTADTTNRLSAAATATLLTHDGSDHRLKINKSAATDTASLLFQTGFSGRAEMGITGSDDFAVKVSPDGSAWQTGLTVAGATGNVGVGTDTPSARLDVDGALRCGSYTVATLPSAAATGAGAMVFVSDETGGAVMAFSDGSDWRRMTDRAVVS